jgi:hypothetical protein
MTLTATRENLTKITILRHIRHHLQETVVQAAIGYPPGQRLDGFV